jgi:hypothetical protein
VESTILIASHLGFLVIGALITGWTAWLFRTEAARAGAMREQTGRRLMLLEEVAMQIASVQHLLDTAAGTAARSGTGSTEEHQQATQRLAAALEDVPLAEARLRLLEEMDLCKVLRLYTRKVTGLRRQLPAAARNSKDEEPLRKALDEINTLHDKLHESLARRYNRKQG